ncbi:MAG: hypothetical protein ABIM49_01415 [candidate division WOR-3 bacterium]
MLPARKNLKKAIFFIVFLIFITLLFTFSFGIFWGIFAFLILFFSNISFFTKTEYEITDKKIIVKRFFYKIEKDWEWVKRIEVDKNGIFLSPFEKKSWLDPFRGIFLLTFEPQKIYDEFKRMGKIKK